MISELRPLSLGEILDRAIAIYRKNFVTLVGIVAIIAAPILVLQLVAALLALPTDPFLLTRPDATGQPNTQFAPFFAYYGVVMLLALIQGIGNIFQTGTLVVAISQAYHGHPGSIRQAYAGMLPRWASLLLALIIVGLVDLAIYFAIFAPFVAATMTGALLAVSSTNSSAGSLGVLAGMGLACLLFIPAVILLIFVNVRWTFQTQAIMLEKLNAVGGLRRSWNLISGSFWRVLGVLAVLVILMWVLAGVPTYAAQMAVSFLMPRSMVASMGVSSVLSAFIQIFIAPIQIAVLTVLYYDLRVRREGYDLDLKAQELTPPPAPPAQTELYDTLSPS